jgi:nitroreductase
MDAIACLQTRRSIRAYESRPVTRDLIELTVDCARMAATAMNVQPWTFVVVQDGATRGRIADAVGHSGFLREAPVVIAVLCRETEYALEDGCAATQNLLNAARALGLGSCWVAGAKMDYASRIVELLAAPADQQIIALVTLGYASEDPQPEKRRLEDVLRWERFDAQRPK